MYFEYVCSKPLHNTLFESYDNLAIQINNFLNDDLRCVFTFDRLDSGSPDLIIRELHQNDMSQMQKHALGLKLLHLDVFRDYTVRFGWNILCDNRTFVLFKQRQVRLFEHAISLSPGSLRIASTHELTALLATWDHTRPSIEKLIIHGLYAEVPSPHALGACMNPRVVSLFTDVANVDRTAYNQFKTIWHNFLRLIFTDPPVSDGMAWSSQQGRR